VKLTSNLHVELYRNPIHLHGVVLDEELEQLYLYINIIDVSIPEALTTPSYSC
jgi:hypothetical protein